MGEDSGIELVLKNISTSISEKHVTQNNLFNLEQNYPNPSSSTTLIKYESLKPAKVKLSIYDLNGKKIMSIVDEKQSSGSYQFQWSGKSSDGTFVSSGSYIYTLSVTNQNEVVSESKTLILK